MTTDTPRTDAAEPQLHSNKGGWVRADFARQLERELASSNAALDQVTEDAVNLKADADFQFNRLTHARHDAFNLSNALSKAEAEVDRFRKQLQQAVDIAEKIWADCSNGSEHTEITALKGEIK